MRGKGCALAGFAQIPDPLHQRALAGRADERGQPAACTAGGEDAKPGDVHQARADGAVLRVGQVERDVGQKHTVKTALQHGGQAVPPRRVDEDQRVAPAQVFHLGRDAGGVGRAVEVALPFRAGQHRLKTLGVKIADADFGTGMSKAGQDHVPHRRVEAVGARVAVHDKGAHGQRPGFDRHAAG